MRTISRPYFHTTPSTPTLFGGHKEIDYFLKHIPRMQAMFDAMIASHSLLLVNALNIVSTPNIICLKMPDFTMRI
jgi:hypothetical protein